MPDEHDRARRGFWMRMAREHAGLSQASAAELLGLNSKSKSTLSKWESGAQEPRASMVARMAALYEVPVELLMSPPLSAYEVIDRRLSVLARDAEALEREDWEAAELRGPTSGGGLGGARRTA